MERVANVVMWKRSIEKNKFRYTALVSDGDTNTYKDICNAKPYGEIPIIKIECVNHVGKRLARALTDLVKTKVFYLDNNSKEECSNYRKDKTKTTENIKKAKQIAVTKAKKKSTGRVVHMGGRHGINAKFIKVMQAYYTFIIKDNDTVEGMQGDIHTMVDHITSTDENPMHDNCPEHRPKEKPSYKSFCFIKRFQWRKKREIIRYRCMIKNDVINQNLPETSEKTRRQYGKSMPKKPLLNRFISKIKRPSHSSMNLRLRFAKGSGYLILIYSKDVLTTKRKI